MEQADQELKNLLHYLNLPGVPRLPPGSYPLTATYSGDDTYATSADTTQTLTVTCRPLLTWRDGRVGDSR